MGKTTRRDFMAYTAALASTTAACGDSGGNGAAIVSDDLTRLSATEAVQAMRSGNLAAEDYASALLARCRQGGYLNAFRTLDAEQVLEAARSADQRRASGADTGLLHGLPIPVKDSVNTRGYPTSGGTRALENFYPSEDAELVRRLTAAGAIVMGKTNIHELSFGWTSNNYAFGSVHNPYNRERIPGGSSGGTAAAIAAGMAPLGIAEDTQGSIRVPAAFCGIYGFRPTQNRYPNQGVVPITPLFDQVGPHARDMADIALFDQVITGEPRVSEPAPLAGLRLGVARDYYFSELDTEVETATTDALRQLEDAGAILVEADVPNLAELISLTTAQVQLYHVKPMLERYLQEFETGLTLDDVMAAVSDDIRATFEEFVLGGAGTPSEADFIAARDEHLPALRQTMRAYFEDNGLDAMVFPAAQITATPVGQDTEVVLNGRTVPFEAVVSRNISPGSTAGLPGLTVPVAQDLAGLPISLEIDGPAGSDRAMLGIGLALEGLFGHLPNPSV
jgi:Asp-tRNA(Asn)/Glu-tRNA(Gln) amidotransferase A subunit family amidase